MEAQKEKKYKFCFHVFREASCQSILILQPEKMKSDL